MSSSDYPTSIDEYTASVSAELNINLTVDSMKVMEEECLQFFKIPRLIQGNTHNFMVVVDDDDDGWDDYSEYDDYVNVDLSEKRCPHAANAYDYRCKEMMFFDKEVSIPRGKDFLILTIAPLDYSVFKVFNITTKSWIFFNS